MPSAPCLSITSSGSIPVPSDLDMRRPSGAWIDRVDVDVGERHLAGELEPHHDHARDPQEEDVARRREHVGRVEGAQLGRVLGPAERRERPQRGGEPRVEHVGVAHPAVALRRLRAARRSPRRGTRPAAGGPTTAGARCTRGGCSPSSRGRRAPSARGGSARGRPRPRSIAGCGELVHAHEPLQRDQRLDRARPSGARTARRACRARCARSRPPRAAPRRPRRAPRARSGPRSARRPRRSCGRPRRSRRSPRARARGRSRSRSGRGRA